MHHHGGPTDSVNRWTFETPDRVHSQGILLNSGYRSAGLLVLVVQDELDKRKTRIPVWRDSVSDLQYSYLNLQLMFNGSKPERR